MKYHIISVFRLCICVLFQVFHFFFVSFAVDGIAGFVVFGIDAGRRFVYTGPVDDGGALRYSKGTCIVISYSVVYFVILSWLSKIRLAKQRTTGWDRRTDIVLRT